MVAAKLDHSRVLVTKFRQNRSTIKGRSASQRHTDTQTDRQTPLKIMALQVCNWDKKTGGWLENKETESVKQTNISLHVGTDPCIYH